MLAPAIGMQLRTRPHWRPLAPLPLVDGSVEYMCPAAEALPDDLTMLVIDATHRLLTTWTVGGEQLDNIYASVSRGWWRIVSRWRTEQPLLALHAPENRHGLRPAPHLMRGII